MRKSIIITLIGILIIAGVSYQFFFRKTEPDFSVAEAKKTNITEEVSVTGSLVPLKRADIETEVQGKVEEVAVEISDKIEEGDLLIKLNQNNAKIQLKKSRANLNSTKEQISLLETKLKNAKKDLEQVKETTADTVAEAQVNLEAKKQNLKDVKETEANETKQVYEDGRSALDSNLLTNKNALLELKTIQQDYFNGADQISLKVKDKLEAAENDQEEAKELIDGANSTKQRSATQDALNSLKTALKTTKEALRYTRDEACENPYYENQLASDIKSTLDTQKSNIETAISKITEAQQTIESQEISSRKNINTAESQLSSAEASLEQAKTQRNQKITQAESKIEELQHELKLQESKKESAESDLEEARQNLEDTTIRAPFDGTVTKVNIEEGETAKPNSVIATIIPEENYKIEADVSEVNIASIDQGDPVNIDFDAFPNKEYQGKVSKIHPAEIIKEGVIYYRIEVLMNNYPNKLKPGFTANLDVITGQKENVVTVPYIAVKEDDQGKYVQMAQDHEVGEKRRVKTGLEGNTEVEVTEGLKAGEKVILSQE